MKFYTRQHKYYCGIDLHARVMYVCLLDSAGKIILHKNMKTDPNVFMHHIRPYKNDIVVAVECMFSWYWIADICAKEDIAFVLGHALYLKAVHGGKAKNDRLDSYKIAALLRGGLFPMAYVYPRKMRATRDLLRRRMHLARKRAELNTHVQNTNTQYNLPIIGKKIAHKRNRTGVAERFEEPSARKSVEVDLSLMNFYDKLITDLELHIVRYAKQHDGNSFHRLRSVPGIGKTLALVVLYEIHDINRFPSVQDFASYCRLVKPARESSGKISGHSGKKIGNAHLKWAFTEAACLFLRGNPRAQKRHEKYKKKHGDGKALIILAHKLARAVYFMLKRKTVFDMQLFMTG